MRRKACRTGASCVRVWVWLYMLHCLHPFIGLRYVFRLFLALVGEGVSSAQRTHSMKDFGSLMSMLGWRDCGP